MAGRVGCLFVLIALLAGGFFLGRDYVRRHPQDFPWTELRLSDPVGRFTASKIAELGDDPARCRAMLDLAGTGDSAAPDRSAGAQCGYRDGMQLAGRESGRMVSYSPAPLVTSCPVAAALKLWEERVVQPAAQTHLGERILRVRHSGSYSCRRLYGRESGAYSEHATADAIDIIGFDLAGGKQVSVLRDWESGGPEARFLREIRDGACGLFSTVLSPEYNQAHRDHLHFDAAERSVGGWTLCR